MSLLNKTLIPYRKLKIPCCKTCNNGPLSKLEKEVKNILSGSFRQLNKNEEFRLYQWSSKILYGLLYKEMTLLHDLKSKASGTIVKRHFLEQLATFHHFITSIIRPFNFVDFVPYSIFVVECLTYSEQRLNFDYLDFITIGEQNNLDAVMVLAMRTNHYGIICVPTDNGYQKEYFQDVIDDMKGIPLHQIQFLELACKAAYKQKLLSFEPAYISYSDNSKNSVVTVIQQSFPRGQVWNNWNNREYAEILYSRAKHNGINIPKPEHLYEGDKITTWLKDDKGRPLNLNNITF